MMNCEQFQRTLHDLDRPGTASHVLRDTALAHAESCTACALLLIEGEALDFSLHSLAAQDANKEAPRRTEAALLREFRRHHAAPPSRAGQWYAAVMGVAAMALLVLGITHFHLDLVTQRPRTANGINRGNVVANSTRSNPAAQTHSATASSANSQPNDSNHVDLASADETTDFYPLPYADDSAFLDGGAVIRVAMPRSTLASWGFPVSGVSSSERIRADLLVGADGTPQAIRLVSETND